jgi:hypothetical protein
MTKQQANLTLYSPKNDINEVQEKGEMILPIFRMTSYVSILIAQSVLAQKPKASGYRIGVTGNSLSLSP